MMVAGVEVECVCAKEVWWGRRFSRSEYLSKLLFCFVFTAGRVFDRARSI